MFPFFSDVLTERTLRHRGNGTCVRSGCRELQGKGLEENVWGQRDVQALAVKPGDLNLRTHMVEAGTHSNRLSSDHYLHTTASVCLCIFAHVCTRTNK